jgi:phenylalanyl-tRNA synthetase alpha subunit
MTRQATAGRPYLLVTTYANFDSVLVPPDHVSRNPNDTYYVTSDTVGRCRLPASKLVLKVRPVSALETMTK